MYYFQVIVGLLGAFAMRTIQVFPWDDQCPLELSQCPLGQSSVPWDSQVSLGTVKCPLGQSSALGTVNCPWNYHNGAHSGIKSIVDGQPRLTKGHLTGCPMWPHAEVVSIVH